MRAHTLDLRVHDGAYVAHFLKRRTELLNTHDGQSNPPKQNFENTSQFVGQLLLTSLQSRTLDSESFVAS